MLEHSGLAEKIGYEYLFPTVHAGAQAFLAQQVTDATESGEKQIEHAAAVPN
jgi:hypothetical protein